MLCTIVHYLCHNYFYSYHRPINYVYYLSPFYRFLVRHEEMKLLVQSYTDELVIAPRFLASQCVCLTTQCTIWTRNTGFFTPPVWTYLTYTLSCIFPLPKSIYCFNTFYVSVSLIVFLLSVDRLWRCTYISVNLFHTRKGSKYHVFISGETWNSQAWLASKYSPSGNFERKNMLLFLTASSFPECFASHAHLHGQLLGSCRALTHYWCTVASPLVLFGTSMHSLVLLSLLFHLVSTSSTGFLAP